MTQLERHGWLDWAKALHVAGYRRDDGSRRDTNMNAMRQQYRWNHLDGSYYVTVDTGGALLSWYYRDLGGSAKSEKYDDVDRTLADHAKKNKKDKPKTKIARRTSEQVRRANTMKGNAAKKTRPIAAPEVLEQEAPARYGRPMTDGEAKKRMASIIARDPKRYAALRRVGALADRIAAERKAAGK